MSRARIYYKKGSINSCWVVVITIHICYALFILKRRIKYIIIGGVIVLTVVSGVIYFKNKDSAVIKAGNNASVSKEEPIQNIVDYNLIGEQVDKKSWVDVMLLSEKYGDSDTNPKQLRIGAFANCVYAANNSQAKETSDRCRKKGLDLIATLNSVEDKESGVKVFDALSTGNKYTEPQNTAVGQKG